MARVVCVAAVGVDHVDAAESVTRDREALVSAALDVIGAQARQIVPRWWRRCGRASADDGENGDTEVPSPAVVNALRRKFPFGSGSQRRSK